MFQLSITNTDTHTMKHSSSSDEALCSVRL